MSLNFKPSSDMKDLQNFLLLCSGVDKSVLKKSPLDINKYVGIGGTVLFTAILAFLAASYAAYTVSDNAFIALGFGLIWGLMIFNLDRYIVSSLKRKGALLKDVIYALPRLAIAVVIAVVISKPIELKLFEKEIDGEIVLMEQEMFAAQEMAVKARFNDNLESLEKEKLAISSELAKSESHKIQLQEAAVAEADGTGGSMKKNLGPIYKLKKSEADKAAVEHGELLALSGTRIEAISIEEAEINTLISAEILALDRKPVNGLAYRMEALNRITEKFPPVRTAELFIFFLFLLIESAPVLVKLISSRSSYDYHLNVREQVVEMYYKELTSKRSNAAEAAIKYDHDVTMYDIHGEIKVKRAQIDEEVRQKISRIKGNVEMG